MIFFNINLSPLAYLEKNKFIIIQWYTLDICDAI